MDSPALGARPDGAKTLFHRDRDGRLGASLRDYGRSISQVVCDDLGRPAANLFREALPPGGWPDPSGPTTEGAPRLDVEGLVAHHPCGPGADAKVARGREQHAGPRFPTGAVRKDVMRTVVHRRNPHAFWLVTISSRQPASWSRRIPAMAPGRNSNCGGVRT